MLARIEQLSEKTLICKSVRMSLAMNKTSELWQSFMTEKKAIENTIGTDLYSIQVYDTLEYFNSFNPQTEFTKYAAIAVSSIKSIPNGFSSKVLKSGLYAVFLHKGPVSSFPKTIQYIFNLWLPNSIYELDHRPHFELLGEKYKNNDPTSEEEVWIPIKLKK